MVEVSVFDAKNRLSALLHDVERGREVVITRRGKPVAKLVSADAGSRAELIVRRARQLREDIARHAGLLTHDDIFAMRDEGRR